VLVKSGVAKIARLRQNRAPQECLEVHASEAGLRRVSRAFRSIPFPIAGKLAWSKMERKSLAMAAGPRTRCGVPARPTSGPAAFIRLTQRTRASTRRRPPAARYCPALDDPSREIQRAALAAESPRVRKLNRREALRLRAEPDSRSVWRVAIACTKQKYVLRISFLTKPTCGPSRGPADRRNEKEWPESWQRARDRRRNLICIRCNSLKSLDSEK
jgi:hypothetical protein